MQILVLAAASGCVRRIEFGARGEITDPRELLAAVSKAEAQVYGVSGEAKAKVRTAQGKGVATIFVAVTHPSLLRMETLDFFGRPTSVLVCDGKSFGLYQADEQRYYTGPASPVNVSRLLPVVLSVEELTALLLGRAPRLPVETGELSVDLEARAYKLLLQKGEVRQTLWIDPVRTRVLKSEVRGASAYDLEFSALEAVGEGSYPRKVILKVPASDSELELTYKDVQVNGAPDLTLYELAAPANVPVVEVDAQGNVAPAPSAP